MTLSFIKPCKRGNSPCLTLTSVTEKPGFGIVYCTKTTPVNIACTELKQLRACNAWQICQPLARLRNVSTKKSAKFQINGEKRLSHLRTDLEGIGTDTRANPGTNRLLTIRAACHCLNGASKNTSGKPPPACMGHAKDVILSVDQ